MIWIIAILFYFLVCAFFMALFAMAAHADYEMEAHR